MKTLFLIRHAKAEDTYGVNDFRRRLQQRGIDEAKLMSSKLFDTGVVPDLIISSSADRALETAQIFAGKFGIPDGQIERNQTAYLASHNRLLAIVNGIDNRYSTVFLFGHNPGITDIINYLCGDTLSGLPKCGIAEIQFDTDDWNAISRESGRVKTIDYPKKQL